MNPTVLRRPRPLDRPAPDVKTLVDRVTAAPVPHGQRKPAHPTFNSAV